MGFLIVFLKKQFGDHICHVPTSLLMLSIFKVPRFDPPKHGIVDIHYDHTNMISSKIISYFTISCFWVNTFQNPDIYGNYIYHIYIYVCVSSVQNPSIIINQQGFFSRHSYQWSFQDPKIEVLYHISGHILGLYSLT